MKMLLDALDTAEPSRLALVDRHEQVTYDELRRQVGKIAAVFYGKYGDGQFLVLRADNHVRFVVSLLGIMASGNTPVPVAHDLPDEDIEYIVSKSQAVGVIEPLAVEAYETSTPEDHRRPDCPAIVMFTSGTTGYPKGVIISHANLRHSCQTIADYLHYREFPSAAVVLPLHYSYALLSQVCCQLSIGGTVSLFENFRNPIKFARQVTEQQLQTFCGVPSTYQALTTLHSLSPLELPTVRVLCSAGAAMNHARLREIQTIFPNAMFFNNYGMTEAAPRIAYIRDDDPRFGEPTCGKPMAGVEIKVVDSETHRTVPEGERGVLVVKGPNITSGYLNDPELTAAAFTDDGYLISNDLAYLDQGYLFICGRNDDVFNVAGEKVAPLEIERSLNHLPEVDMSAVTGIADEQRGMVPVAFVKLKSPVARDQLIAGLDGHLPAVKIPQRYFEVREFPMTANGKLRRHVLSVDDDSYVVREID